MAVKVRDVLKINIVFVGLAIFNEPEEARQFSDDVDADVEFSDAGSMLGLPVGLPTPARKFALQRDRINIDSMPDRTAIEREFPSDTDLERLAEVADKALQHTVLNGAPRAFGYNIELVYDQTSGDPASSYIVRRLFGKGEFAPESWKLQGGAGRLIFDSPAGRWTIRIEPRFNDDASPRVFLNLNLHKSEQRIPDQGEMLSSFKNVWAQAHYVIERMDESNA